MSMKKIYVGVGTLGICAFLGYWYIQQSLSSVLVSFEQTDTALLTASLSEFASSTAAGTSSKEEIVTTLGIPARASAVSVIPSELIEDSRCPVEVTCIQAGTVRVRATVVTSTQMVERTFVLVVPVELDNYVITLSQVTSIQAGLDDSEEEERQFTFTVDGR